MATLDVPGGRLRYQVIGAGVPVVLVHGLALDLRMWDDQVSALADVATVIRYDVRGFGESIRDETTEYTHADDLWRLVDHLGLNSVVLVGLSMGGAIAVEAALAAPARVMSLVLLDAVLDGVPWDPESRQGMAAIGEQLHTGGLAAAKVPGCGTPSSHPLSAMRVSQRGCGRWSTSTRARSGPVTTRTVPTPTPSRCCRR